MACSGPYHDGGGTIGTVAGPWNRTLQRWTTTQAPRVFRNMRTSAREKDIAQHSPEQVSLNVSDRSLSRILPTVRAVVRRYAHDKDHAEDLTQECVIHIARKRHTCCNSEEGAVHGWAWKVSDNLCKSITRTEHARDAATVREYDDIPDHAPLPDAQAERTRRKAAVRRAVARLPDRTRAAIELVYLREMAHREAAGHLGVGIDAVRSRLVRGIQGLRQMPELTGWAPAPGGNAATEILGPGIRGDSHPILALVQGVEARNGIRNGLRLGELDRVLNGVHFVTGWRELNDMVALLPGCPVIVDLEPPPPGQPGFKELRALRGRHPQCPLIGNASDPGFLWPKNIRSEIGFVTILRCGECSNPEVVRLALLHAAGKAEADCLLVRLRKSVRPEAHSLLDAVLHGSLERRSVMQLAKSMKTTTRTLGRTCRALGLPTPRRLLALAVVFHVERLARWAHQRRASAALVVGFSAPGAYRRTLRRVLGSTPTEVDQRGGPDYVARVMLRECEYR